MVAVILLYIPKIKHTKCNILESLGGTSLVTKFMGIKIQSLKYDVTIDP